MINLNTDFIYYRDLGLVDCIDAYYLFDETQIYDVVPLKDVYIEIYINHNKHTINHTKVFINNIEHSLYMDNYQSIKIIINVNEFLKNKKLNE